MQLDLSGKTALVTGGARGIGAEISRIYALAGANVIVAHLAVEQDVEGARMVREQIEGAGGRCICVEADVTCPDQIDALVERCNHEFDAIDILVNSAGFARPAGIDELTVDAWRHGIEVNLTGAY
ncbi:MAG TPA: SDR family NAD(P)-dependent oxidoreductase, partial [Spirochaetia bacterium]|nr:SDR family NAD(P)-dependent oxidoreductase [Spirochaetia bacterium]